MARYRIQFGDQEIDLPRGELLVGRGEACHLRLKAPSVSRQHLRILTVASRVMAYDLDSRNGTWVNETKVEGPVELGDGDRIRVGTQTFNLREVLPESEWEAEPDTWETLVDSKVRAPENGAGERPSDFARTTQEMDTMSVDQAEAIKSMAMGTQMCATCGTAFEFGQKICPVCSVEPYSTPSYRTCPQCKNLVLETALNCPKCGYSRHTKEADSLGHDERRSSPRLPARIRALYVSSSLTFDAEVSNISIGGLFLAADLLDPVGTQADILISTADRGGARLVGQVAHVVTQADPELGVSPGIGVRFTQVSEPAKRWLEAYLETTA